MRFADNTMLFHNAIFTKEICFQRDTDEGRSMTFITLVYETLKRYGKPLTFLGIWTQAQKFGYVDQLQSAGKTPMKTLEARVYLDLRDNQDTPLIQISKRPATFALKGMTLPNENEKSISTTEAKNAASSKNTGKKPKGNKQAKTPEQKLFKRIEREINRFKYIGDISIDDDEYDILIRYLKRTLSDFSGLRRRRNDPLLAVALVQIGIREYNGRFWPHVSRIAECKLDGIKQGVIGSVFYDTLVAHEKYHLDKSQIVNNILMHCFVTKNYADDFFEFLFAYYQHDLDRDLSQHTKEMRDHLLACMKKAEDSSRAFRIKKGTADAATANERGCKIRVRNILKWMDAYLFENTLPDQSPNRTARFFCQWARTSKRFRMEKSSVSGYGTKGKIRFRTPYLHFDRKNEKFYLVLPVQTVPLNDDETSASLSWKISYNGTEKTIDSETENTVIGCRNLDKEYFEINSADIFSKFRVELIKNNNETVKKFAVHSDTARLFDDEFDFFAGERLYEGTVYAFTQRDQKLQSDGFSTWEHYLGLDFYSLELVKGNVVKKPDGQALYVGKEIEEGLSVHNRLGEAFVLHKEQHLPIYNKTPSLLLKASENILNGTLLIINGTKHRLNAQQCLVFNSEQNKAPYSLIELEKYISQDGIYEILVDLPSERRTRDYSFALSNGLNYGFVGTPYVFKTQGEIHLTKQRNENEECLEEIHSFSIKSDSMFLNLSVGELQLFIPIPMLKWRFDLSDDWHIEKPEELWHKEFPDYIYFQTPIKSISLCSDQITLDDDELQNIKCDYYDETDCYVCDTRKIKSWLEIGSAIHKFSVLLYDEQIPFLSLITRSILLACSLKADEENSQLVIKSTIFGFADCAVDIYSNGEKIADKISLSSNGAKFSTNVLSGQFEVVFFECDDDDEFDFGDTIYSEFERRRFTLKEKRNLVGKIIRIDYLTEKKQDHSMFFAPKYNFIHYLTVKIVRQDEKDRNIYYGVSQSSKPNISGLDIQIKLLERKTFSKALVLYFNNNEETYIDFIYDKTNKELCAPRYYVFSRNNATMRFLEMTPDTYYHITVLN